MVSCHVRGCKNFSKKKNGRKVRYFSFPKNPEDLKRWIMACGRDKPFITTNVRICSEHFTDNDWKLQDTLLNTPLIKRKLKFGAIPTRNLPSITKKMKQEEEQDNEMKCEKITSIYNSDFQKMEYNDLNIEQSDSGDMTDPEYLLPDDGNTDQNFDYEKADDTLETEEFNAQNANTKKNSRIWINPEITMRLIDLYNESNPKVGKFGHFLLKKDMHNYIATKLNEEFGEQYTGEQINGRIKNVTKRRVREELLKQKNAENNEIDIAKYNLESLYDVDENEYNETENENDDTVDNSQNFTNQQSRKLIRLYNMFMPNVRNQFKTHKEAWEAIRDELEFEFGVKYTAMQCYKKYKSIVRKARTLLARKKSSPKSKQTIQQHIKTRSKAWDLSDRQSIYIKETDSVLEDNFPYHRTENEDNYNPLFNKSIRNVIKTHEHNDVDFFEKKTRKFHDKELMKEYIEFKKEKAKQELHRHEEIMEQLQKINKTLLDIKNQTKS